MKTKTFRALLSTTVFLLLLTLLAWTAVSCSQTPGGGNESESESESETESGTDNLPGTPSDEDESLPTANLSGTSGEEETDSSAGADNPSADLDAMTEEVLADLQKQLQDIRTMLLGTSEPAPLPYTYVVENGKVTVTGYTGEETTVVVPAEIEGCPVTAIGERAFAGTSVQCVTLPDTVTDVDWFAFWQCASLMELHLPASVASIGYAAFDGCSSVLTLVCPKGSYAARYAASYGIPCQAP